MRPRCSILLLVATLAGIAEASCAPKVGPRSPVLTAAGVRFSIARPEAARVALAGSFNQWSPSSHPLARDAGSGLWTVVVPLPPGEHLFMFVIDGAQWVSPRWQRTTSMTGSGRGMESSLFRRHEASGRTRVMVLVLIAAAWPGVVAAQAVSAPERESLVRLRVERGGRADEVDALLRHAAEAAAKGLPAAPLTNKIREGLAKGADPRRIDQVIRQMAVHLETADGLMRDIEPMPGRASRDALVTLLAESLGGGVTPDEVRELRRQLPSAAAPPGSSETVASAAKGLSFIKDVKLPAGEGAEVMGAAVQRGYRPQEMLALGREIKRREADYRAGRASLRELRDAIRRGERANRLFRDSRRTDARTATERPATQVDRPERPNRPDTRPEPPERPTRTGGR